MAGLDPSHAASVICTVLLLLFAILGHTTLWISLVNRVHGRPWPEAWLRSLRHVHDAFILGFPPILICGAGLLGPRLLLDGTWSQLTWPWWILFVICWSGSGWLLYVATRYGITRDPKQLVASTSHRIEIARELGKRPVDHGPYERLAWLPFNEQFSVEVTQKTLQLDRLPVELEGLTIWHLSDWHFSGTLRHEYFERVVLELRRKPADMICFTGDLIDNLNCTTWFPETLGKLQAEHGMYYILGNHDWHRDPDTIRAQLTQLGWRDVASQVLLPTIRGRQFALGGDETPWMGTAPNFAALEDDLFRLLLSHTPDNIRRAQSQRIDLMLSGHTHGGQVQLPLIGPVYSPSLYGCKFSSGTFYQVPTLLHVSRGLAGLHPLRWRCAPEVTRLTLRRAPSAERQ